MAREEMSPITINGLETHIRFLEGSSNKEIHPLLRAKLVPREELSTLGDFLNNRGLKKVFTTGVYDMIHIGHARYLHLAKSLGDVLIVGLNTDDSVRRIKGPNRPILEERKRAEMLSFITFVDYITPFQEDTGAEVIKILRPEAYLCVEGSWEGDIATKAEVVAVTELGGEIYYTPRQDPFLSTSEIINRIEVSYGQQLLEQFSHIVRKE